MDDLTEADDEPAIQPQVGVPTDWVATFENSQEARRLAELEADRELLDRLMWGGYTGPEYEVFAERLVRYGLTVMTAWCRSGAIFNKCAQKGWTVENPVRIDPDEVEGVANATVGVAIVKFRETVLIPAVWDHRKGASLKTFFIGQCLLRFLNEHRRWQRSKQRSVPVARDPAAVLDPPSTDRRPDESVIAAEGYTSALDDLTEDPQTRAVCFYKAEGYGDEEIAELTGLSVASVKSRLYRLRKKEQRSA
jgi:hypothetical protein